MMIRRRYNFIKGILSQELPNNNTTNSFYSEELTPIPDMGNVDDDYMVIVLDPGKVYGEPEIVELYFHLQGFPEGGIRRAREGTSARVHPVGTKWRHAATVRDFEEPSCVVYRNSNQTGLSTFAWNLVTFNDEYDDPYGFHSTVTNPSRITPVIPGRYVFVAQLHIASCDGGIGASLVKNSAGALENGESIGADQRSLGVGSDGTWSDTRVQVNSFPISMNGTTDHVEAFAWIDVEDSPVPNIFGTAGTPSTTWFSCHRVGG